MAIYHPFNWAVVHAKSDSANIAGPRKLCDALYVGTVGNVVAVLEDDRTVLFTGVPAGTILPIAIKRVNSTSTTADTFVALFKV